MKTNKRNVAGLISIAISISFFVGAAWLLYNRQYAVDQLAVWQYTPAANIVEVANNAGLNDNGKFYFYATHPEIDGTSNFNDECTRQEKGSAVLGCYVHNNIYIYDVTDKRLHGVKAVTAAHETLHAIYARLSDSERDYVNRLIEAEYKKLDSSDLNDRMDYYARTEPGQRDNELHSIIGTEFLNLSPELEEYYSRYFSDRASVVKQHASYNDQFKQRAEQRKTMGKKLDTLAADIKKLSEQYNTGVDQLNSDIDSFNNRAKRGDFYSQAQFDRERNVLVARSDSLASIRSTINTKMKQYETLRVQYNALVDESNSLQKSLDSSLAPAPEI